jgi:membrane protein implicated in regulation of membrane protease activity
MTMFKLVFWYWWALAGALLVCEMLLPGVVFMFLAIGAAAAGLVLLVAADAPLELQLAVFAVVAVASAIVLRPFLKRLQHHPTADPTLNARGQGLVGKVFVLDQPILAGRGRVKLGDGSWIVTGPDMVAGAKVRVASVSGTELRVEPAP